MDLFEHESQYSVHLCEDENEQTYIRFEQILKGEMGAEEIDEMWSPYISWIRFRVHGETITVQYEPFLGIDVFGSKEIIDDVMRRVQQQ